MTRDFTSFSIVVQSYQDGWSIIIRLHAMEPSLHLKIFVSSGNQTWDH